MNNKIKNTTTLTIHKINTKGLLERDVADGRNKNESKHAADGIKGDEHKKVVNDSKEDERNKGLSHSQCSVLMRLAPMSKNDNRAVLSVTTCCAQLGLHASEMESFCRRLVRFMCLCMCVYVCIYVGVRV